MKIKELIAEINDNKVKFNLDFYLVGGAVRDLVLGLNPTDLDFVYTGKSNEIENFINKTFNPQSLEISQFNTYKLEYKNFSIDFAMCRQEVYTSPGSLPVIKEGDLKQDQQRRDFTMNTLYIDTKDFSLDNIIDPYNGFNDIKSKLIKTLHVKSFSDDPTRIFRAIRYAKRLDFKIDNKTNNQIEEFRFNINKLSGTRIRNEIYKILNENKVIETIKTCENLGVFKSMNLELSFPPSNIDWEDHKSFDKLISNEKSMQNKFLLMLVTFFSDTKDDEIELISKRFHFERTIKNKWIDIVNIKKQLNKLDFDSSSDSKLYNILQKSNIQICIGLTQWFSSKENMRIYKYWNTTRKIEPNLKSKDLLELGINEGPKIGELLKELKKQVINNVLQTKEQEIEFVKNITNLD